MKDFCSSYAKYKGVFLPRCNCSGCWFVYFGKNGGKFLAAKQALETMGESAIVKTHGKKYLRGLKFVLSVTESK